MEFGWSLSIHKSYIHDTHNFHIDSTADLMKRYHPDLRHYQAVVPLTMVMYLLDPNGSDPNAQTKARPPPGCGTTSVAPKSHHYLTFVHGKTMVSACPLETGTISIFPAGNMHSVAPNPGFVRATIALKVCFYADIPIDWSADIEPTFKSMVDVYRLSEVSYSTDNYGEVIKTARDAVCPE